MITDERIASFIQSFYRDDAAWIMDLRKEAEKDGIPIIRRETGEFIKLLLMIKQPERILEIGSAIGFSAIFMSRFLKNGAKITTIENYEPRILRARENIKKTGAEETITLLAGDALEILPTLKESYDFIFMDAAKGQYGQFFRASIPLLSENGILLCDNVLQDGEVLESRFAVTRRNRTIHARMRDFLYEITHHPEIETAILNIGDGVSLSIKGSYGYVREKN